MLQNYSRYRILQEFFDSPRKDFMMRELSRKTNIAQPSVSNHLKALVKEGLLVKENKGLYPTYQANRDSEKFRSMKKTDLLLRLQDVTDHLYETFMPDAIVLFGSSTKGEDTEESDIDLLLVCKEKKIDLKRYEKKLNRKINAIFIEDFKRLSKELKNNIANGIVLKGYLEAF